MIVFYFLQRYVLFLKKSNFSKKIYCTFISLSLVHHNPLVNDFGLFLIRFFHNVLNSVLIGLTFSKYSDTVCLSQ